MHDKVEFEVVLYVMHLTWKEKELIDKGFSKNECNLILSSLKKLIKIINQRTVFGQKIDSIYELERKEIL